MTVARGNSVVAFYFSLEKKKEKPLHTFKCFKKTKVVGQVCARERVGQILLFREDIFFALAYQIHCCSLAEQGSLSTVQSEQE